MSEFNIQLEVRQYVMFYLFWHQFYLSVTNLTDNLTVFHASD
jgi:hypothetical protein